MISQAARRSGSSMVLAAAAALLTLSCPGAKKQALLVEYDYVDGTEAVTTNADASIDLAGELEEAGEFEVKLLGGSVADLPPERTLGEIHGDLEATKDNKEDAAADGSWYVHGLVVRKCSDALGMLNDGLVSCDGLVGMAWMMSTETGAGKREDFVIFDFYV